MFWRIFWSFFRTGLLGFGGGAAIAPAMHKEVVEKYGWVDEKTFNDVLALANTLPGPSAPQMAASIGYKTYGLAGAIGAVTALIVPVAIAIVILANWIFSSVEGSSEKLLSLRKATIGIFPLVSAMICGLIFRFYNQGKESLGSFRTICLSIICFIIIDDNNYGAFSMPFGIDNAFLILSMIYLCLVLSSPWGQKNKTAVSLPAVVFLLLHSKVGFFSESPSWVGWSMAILLMVISIFAIITTPPMEDVDEGAPDKDLTPVFKDLIKLWSACLIFSGIAIFWSPILSSISYLHLLGGMIFTGLMTFGGGPVFIPLALDLLAGPTSYVYLYSEEKFMQYLAIINSLPSPIITKTAAVSGFDIVMNLGGKIGENGITPLNIPISSNELLLWAIVGSMIMVIAMTLPAVTNAIIAFSSLSKLRRSRGMRSMSKYIITVLIAIFASVFINFMRKSVSTIASFPDSSMAEAIGHTIFIFSFIYWLNHRKKKLPGFVGIGLVVLYGLIIL